MSTFPYRGALPPSHYQIAGYVFAVERKRWQPILLPDAEQAFCVQFYAQDYKSAYKIFLKDIAEGHPHVIASLAAFKRGIEDGAAIFIDDDHTEGTLLDVNAIARATGFNRSYIKAEIKAGRLKALKEGREHRIHVADYVEWYEKRAK